MKVPGVVLKLFSSGGYIVPVPKIVYWLRVAMAIEKNNHGAGNLFILVATTVSSRVSVLLFRALVLITKQHSEGKHRVHLTIFSLSKRPSSNVICKSEGFNSAT